jgi:ferrochelatase
VVPVQFLADHLETLYDVDVGARAQAEAYGLRFRRIESLNADPRLIAALAAVTQRTIRDARATARKTDKKVDGNVG